jgi:phosphatidylinositol 3-kinase
MMFKTGDDMRQDSLVLQLFNIIDSILTNVGLDMKFTIYNLVPMTKDDGLLQFVANSRTIYDIINKDKITMSAHLEKIAKESSLEYQSVLDNYIATCAGYCVATFLLGIGDRHLENLMITHDGKLFHIDFGFIFGKEPNSTKQRMSTKIRISKFMVQPMGGIDGAHY